MIAQHRFLVGERVRLLRGNMVLKRAVGACLVERLMPVVGHQPLYQVRSEFETCSRVVAETDLVPVGQELPSGEPATHA